MHNSGPLHHLNNHVNYSFNWLIISNVLNNKWSQKNQEAIYISFKRPELNDQFKHNELVRLRNGIA